MTMSGHCILARGRGKDGWHMDMAVKDAFSLLWRKYFNGAELPISFYYTDDGGHTEKVKPGSVSRCLIGALSEVRKGRSLCFDADSIGCPGGRRYAGFADKLMPNFEYFLSCGIPGKMKGERYKKSPELVKEVMKLWPVFKAPSRFIVFKRWDLLAAIGRAGGGHLLCPARRAGRPLHAGEFRRSRAEWSDRAVRRRLLFHHSTSLSRREVGQAQRSDRHVRHLRQAVRAPGCTHLLGAHGQVRSHDRECRGELPHHGLLAQGPRENRVDYVKRAAWPKARRPGRHHPRVGDGREVRPS